MSEGRREEKETNLKISIASNNKSSSDELDSPIVSSPGEKEFVKQNGIQNLNRTTQLALRAIGHSLANPFDSSAGNANQHSSESNTSNAISSPESSGEIKGSNSKSRFFHLSKKHLCKSQSNVSNHHHDSITSLDEETKLVVHTPSESDIDIVAFQRELINLPTFVMDTPATDVSPIFLSFKFSAGKSGFTRQRKC